jgi:hypothetical protein
MRVIADGTPDAFAVEATVALTRREIIYLTALLANVKNPAQLVNRADLGFTTRHELESFDASLHGQFVLLRDAA